MPYIVDINGYLAPRVGSTGNVVTTSGFGTITSITVNGISCSITATASNQATFTIPELVDGQPTPFLGYYHDNETRSIVTFTVSDGTNTDTLTKRILPPANLMWVTLETGFLTTESGSILYNFSPAPAVNDQIYYDPTTCSVDVQGRFRSHLNTTQTLWHREFSSGTVRSFTVTTADSSDLSVTLTGVSATASVGTITPSLGGSPLNVSLTGVAATANVGTITPSLGSGADLTVSLTGVAGTASVGTITPSLGGAPLGVTLTGVSATANTGSIVASITEYVADKVSENLPTFLVESVSKLRKTFRKSFRKK